MSKIIHIEFKELTNGAKHFYFGSQSAIFDTFTVEQVGVSYRSLLNHYSLESEPYENKKCIIRQGELKRKKTNRGIKTNIR